MEVIQLLRLRLCPPVADRHAQQPGKKDSECARNRTAWPLLAVELKAGREARPGSNRRHRLGGLAAHNLNIESSRFYYAITVQVLRRHCGSGRLNDFNHS